MVIQLLMIGYLLMIVLLVIGYFDQVFVQLVPLRKAYIDDEIGWNYVWKKGGYRLGHNYGARLHPQKGDCYE